MSIISRYKDKYGEIPSLWDLTDEQKKVLFKMMDEAVKEGGKKIEERDLPDEPGTLL